MGSTGGSYSSSASYYQAQQLALQKQQLELSQRQHEESMALQRDALNKPTAAVQKDVSLATQNIVEDQLSERQKLKGIRSTYSMFAKQADDENNSAGATKLGE